jgi:hypothetical protein
MKVFFASLTDMSLEVDAWVPNVEQGYTLLAALVDKYQRHSFIARARMQRYHNYEERFIGTGGAAADDFLNRVAMMGRSEPIKGDAR